MSKRRSFTIDELSKRRKIGRTTIYAEINDGRLIARKIRGRTVITDEDEAAWLASLPKVGDPKAA